MDRKTLSKYYHLTQEIKEIEEKIIIIKSEMPSCSKTTGMPVSGNISNPTERKVQLILKYTELLENKKNLALEEMVKIENIIAKINDTEIRRIFNKRYIELKKWERIAQEMHMSERTIFRKHSQFLKECKNV